MTCDPQQLMVTFDNDADPGIKKKISPLQDGENLRILVKIQDVDELLRNFIGGMGCLNSNKQFDFGTDY